MKKLGTTARAFTLASTATTLGFTIGPVLGGVLPHSRGYAPSFGVAIVWTVLAVVLVAMQLLYVKMVLQHSTLPS